MAEVLPFAQNTISLIEHIKRINDDWKQTSVNYVDGVIKTGQDLIAAQDEHGKLSLRNFAEKLPFSYKQASMLMIVTTRFGPASSSARHRAQLPASWYLMYLIAKLPEDIMHAALQDGRIHPNMERKNARALMPPKVSVPRGDAGKILEVFKQADKGLTVDEVDEKLGTAHASRRVSELIAGGHLKATGRTRKTRGGKSAKIYKHEPNPVPVKRTAKKDTASNPVERLTIARRGYLSAIKYLTPGEKEEETQMIARALKIAPIPNSEALNWVEDKKGLPDNLGHCNHRADIAKGHYTISVRMSLDGMKFTDYVVYYYPKALAEKKKLANGRRLIGASISNLSNAKGIAETDYQQSQKE